MKSLEECECSVGGEQSEQKHFLWTVSAPEGEMRFCAVMLLKALNGPNDLFRSLSRVWSCHRSETGE